MADRKKERVVVAMSGGVDSSAAALLLVRQGYDVIGVSMRLYSYEKDATHGCCTPEDLYDARRVADHLGIPHYVSDFEKVFETNVIDNFVESYRAGETPNPCARCNQDVKFSALMKRATELGADYLATGHYARKEIRGDRHILMRARDRNRDQSYFLFGLTQADLRNIVFPLGDLEKPDVRALAAEAGLKVADKPDSQEICFVPKDYATFVESRLEPEGITRGKIVDEAGQVLGAHDGIHRYTVGQRKGLGVTSLLPTYVLSVGRSGDVIVGPDESLYRKTFSVRELTWVGEPPSVGESVLAKIRSRFEGAPATIESAEKGRIHVRFDESQRAITPGQAAVFYRGDECLGGGWIDRID